MTLLGRQVRLRQPAVEAEGGGSAHEEHRAARSSRSDRVLKQADKRPDCQNCWIDQSSRERLADVWRYPTWKKTESLEPVGPMPKLSVNTKPLFEMRSEHNQMCASPDAIDLIHEEPKRDQEAKHADHTD